MDIQIINEIATAAPGPVLARNPERIVLALARPQTATDQDDAMIPGADRSEAGLIAEALVAGSGEGAAPETAASERVLKPWGIAMLPDEARDARQPPEETGTGEETLPPPEKT